MSILRNKWILALVALVIVAGVIMLNPLGIGKATAPTYLTEKVQRSNLVASVNSSGSVQPAADVNLTFQSSGPVQSILAHNGDEVMTGTVLAQLNTDDLKLLREQSQANLNQAKANLDKVKAGPGAKDIANAQSALDSARASLDKVKNGSATASDVAAAQSQLDSARANLANVKAGATRQDIAASQAQVDQANANLAKAKVGATTQDIAAASASVRQAQASLDKLKQPPNASDLQAAQTALDAAKAQQAKVKAGADTSVLSAAQAKVDQAQSNLDSTKANYASQKQDAQIAIDQAANVVRNAQDNLTNVYNQTHDTNGNFKSDPPGHSGYYEELYSQAQRTEQDAEGGLTKARTALDSIKQQEIDAVNTAQTSLGDAKTALTQLQAGPTPSDLAQAQSAVDQAQASLDKLKRGASVQDLAGAQAAVDQAQANLDKLKAGPTAADIAAAQAAVDQAKANLAKVKEGPTQASIAAAQAQVDQAVASLNKVKQGGAADDVAQAQALVDQAQNTLADLKAGAKPEDIAAAQAQVDQAQASFDQAQLHLDNATLTAPFQGVIVNVPLTVGQNVGAGTVAMNMIDNREYHIDVNVNESDIAGVKKGAAVSITFDALPNAVPISGTVKFVSPKGSTQAGNVISYLVTIVIHGQPDNSGMRAGLTANTAIVTAQKSSVLVIPNRLVRTEGNDNVVYVLKGQQAVRTLIQLGLSNDDNSEILSGLNEGDLIITNPPAARQSTAKIGGG